MDIEILHLCHHIPKIIYLKIVFMYIEKNYVGIKIYNLTLKVKTCKIISYISFV